MGEAASIAFWNSNIVHIVAEPILKHFDSTYIVVTVYLCIFYVGSMLDQFQQKTLETFKIVKNHLGSPISALHDALENKLQETPR